MLASLKESGVKLSGYAKRFLTEPEGWLEGLHEGTYEEGYRQYLYDFQSWPPVDKLRGKGVLQRLKTFFPKCKLGSLRMKGSCAYLLQQTYGAMLGALGTDDGPGFDWSAGTKSAESSDEVHVVLLSSSSSSSSVTVDVVVDIVEVELLSSSSPSSDVVVLQQAQLVVVPPQPP